MVDDNYLEIYTDGSCFNNGKKGANGGIGINFPSFPSLNFSGKVSGKQTNQRAELEAILKALQICEYNSQIKNKKIKIYSDSTYSINTITKWMSSWKNNGWKKRDGKEIANIDLIQALYDKMKDTRTRLGRGTIKFEHVKGHSNDPNNDLADYLARKGSEM